jgi:hypothetical protein
MLCFGGGQQSINFIGFRGTNLGGVYSYTCTRQFFTCLGAIEGAMYRGWLSRQPPAGNLMACVIAVGQVVVFAFRNKISQIAPIS